jgi:transcriptional regulator with XRE-family HTH domain
VVVTPDSQGQDLGAQIGSRVRHHRRQRGISGVKLAAAAGISQPFLSQLESGQTSVAIATLYRIAHALGVDPADLLPAPEHRAYEVVRSDERQQISLSEHLEAATARAIFRGGNHISELYDYELSPNDFVADWFSSEAEHALYVLEGALRFEFEAQPEILLEAGDAIFYDSRTPHRWHTIPDRKARVILVAVSARPPR